MARLTVVNIAMELPVRMDDALVLGSPELSQGLSFEQLIATQEPRVRRLAHRLLGWRDGGSDVDDVVQDVFLAALKNLGAFRGDASIATWLTRVTINRCRTHQRKQFLWLRLLRRQRSLAAAPAADERSVVDETSSIVQQAVQHLAGRDREVIVLLYLEQLTHNDIASLLGITRRALDVRLHRARVRLKEKLKGLADDLR